MTKMMWWQALDKLCPEKQVEGGVSSMRYWSWGCDGGIFMARAEDDCGVIQLDNRETYFGNWSGIRGTDGALLQLENGDVYDESGNLISKGRAGDPE